LDYATLLETKNMIKVLIVEDSRVVQEFLAYTFMSDPEIQVLGVVGDGREALEFLKTKRPDVITMDIHMPNMDGLEATKRIMETYPTPIVIVSASDGAKSGSHTFNLIDAGALAVVHRPLGIDSVDHKESCAKLIQTVKLMSEIKVVRRFRRVSTPKKDVNQSLNSLRNGASDIRLIAIGASTGGPPALRELLSDLPKNLTVPILIVQHIALGFVEEFMTWLGTASGFPLKMAKDGETLIPGQGYIAPDDFQMGIDAGLRIVLGSEGPENGLKPSVAYLFRSVNHSLGPNAAGILLSGMGRDGAEELKSMRDSGALTIVQDEESSVVYGMPGEAVKLNAASLILPPKEIAAALMNYIQAVQRRQR